MENRLECYLLWSKSHKKGSFHSVPRKIWLLCPGDASTKSRRDVSTLRTRYEKVSVLVLDWIG